MHTNQSLSRDLSEFWLVLPLCSTLTSDSSSRSSRSRLWVGQLWTPQHLLQLLTRSPLFRRYWSFSLARKPLWCTALAHSIHTGSPGKRMRGYEKVAQIQRLMMNSLRRWQDVWEREYLERGDTYSLTSLLIFFGQIRVRLHYTAYIFPTKMALRGHKLVINAHKIIPLWTRISCCQPVSVTLHLTQHRECVGEGREGMCGMWEGIWQ